MELLLLSLCIFLCNRSLIFRVEVYPVWMARELGSHIFHLMYLLAFFLFALKKPHETCHLTSLLNQLKLQVIFWL